MGPSAFSIVASILRLYSHVAPSERGSYRLARLARWMLPRPRWSDRFRAADGLELQLDLVTYPDCCMAVGLYELDTYRIIRRLLQPGMWFVDVGANIGYFSLVAARRVGSTGRVDSIEPDPVNRRRLEENIARNALPCPIHVHAVAAAEAEKQLELFHPLDSESNHGMASAYGGAMFERAEKYTVRAERLDQLLTDERRAAPDLVKMDVEGGELLAIEGMSGWLKTEKPPAVIVEHNPTSAAAAEFKPGDVMRRLLEIQPRYHVAWIGWRPHPVASPEQLDDFPRQVNLLALFE